MTVKVNCNCSCHTNPNMVHCFPCCYDGIATIEISDKLDYLDLLKLQDLVKNHADELTDEEKEQITNLLLNKNSN